MKDTDLSENMIKMKMGKDAKDKKKPLGHSCKAAFLNLNRILQETKEGQKRGQNLRDVAQQKDKELKAMDKGQKAQIKEAQLAAKKVLDEMQQKALAEMEQMTIPHLQTIIQERGLNMVLSYPQPGVVFVSQQLDITDEIIRRLDKKQ